MNELMVVPKVEDEITLNLDWTMPEGLSQDLRMLTEILKLKRVAGGKAEATLIKALIEPLGAKSDNFGNYVLDIKRRDGKFSKVLWSCHTDTVHHSDGVQKLTVVRDTGVLGVDAVAGCLGADDGAGLWLLLQMIEAKIPGHYIFHREEEIGRKGSLYQAKCFPKRLKRYKIAIAFDRRGTTSIITHQMGVRTCSDAFADSLSAAIGMKHVKDTTGSYTDTASYQRLIDECTNVSVGYAHEHSVSETLDTVYLLELRDKMIKFDEDTIVVSRDHNAVPEYKTYTSTRSYYGGHYTGYEEYGDGDSAYGYGYHYRPQKEKNTPPLSPQTQALKDQLDMEGLIRANARNIAVMLAKWQFTYDTLADAIFEETGSIAYPARHKDSKG